MGEFGQRAAVEVDHRPLARAVEPRELAAEAESGVVDEQRNSLARRLDIGHQLGHRARRAKVAGNRAGMAELARQRIEPILAPRDEHQPIALGRQLSGEVDAQPGRRAGNEGDGCHAKFHEARIKRAIVR